MKYVIIIPDGGADLPIQELNGLTPLEMASTPNLDALAPSGRLGTARTTPEGFDAGSDVCTMSLLGYEPSRYHTGRAPLEAAALGIETRPNDWIFRLNLVTVDDEGVMRDHSAGAIPDAEASELVQGLTEHWRAQTPELCKGISVTPGESYRSILVDASGDDCSRLVTTPPHEIPDQPFAPSLPSGAGSEKLRALMDLSHVFLSRHEINTARAEAGLRPANMAWIWGQGTRPEMPSFESRFGLRGAMLTSVDLLRGIANLIGWDLIECEGLTSYHDTDYAAQGRATIDAIARYDIVCCHVEAPDEASHQGDVQTKVASLEAIDTHIIGPLVGALKASGDPWRVLVMPDHYTLCSTRKHDATPVPVCIAGSHVDTVVPRVMTESEAYASDLKIAEGSELMEYFLRSGIPGVGSR